ncbi:MAG: TlpA family protein disulfide reductase [Ilumatobacteraceae bacterium]
MIRHRTSSRLRVGPLLLVVVAAVACGSDSSSLLPDVDVETFDGAVVSLTDVDGPAVVNLWATWCAPCRREIPDFEAVHRERGADVRFVGINIGDDVEDAAAFLDEIDVTYDQYRDPGGYVVTALGTSTMPVTLVVAPDGSIATTHLGPMDQDDLRRAIDAALVP